jgi:pyruvate,orthophosphate dikinase
VPSVTPESPIDLPAAASALTDIVGRAASGAITRSDALMQVTAAHLEAILHTQFEGGGEVIATGIAASPGAAVGRVYFTSDDALDADDRGEDVILVRNETTPADVTGMQASQGLLTSRGGLASHAALVARGWGTPAIVGAQHLEIGESSFTAGDVVVRQGDVISIDGSTGEVVLGELATSESERPPEGCCCRPTAGSIRSGRRPYPAWNGLRSRGRWYSGDPRCATR